MRPVTPSALLAAVVGAKALPRSCGRTSRSMACRTRRTDA
jgi:hypothetical protein